MNLIDAPFQKMLKIQTLAIPSEEVRLVLLQLGLDDGEIIKKLHIAPLGDPLSILVGEQVFSLRKEICACIQVEETHE